MTDAAEPEHFIIGSCRLDLGRGTLTRDGDHIPLRAKTFALIACLARHAGGVVSKDDLIATVWPEVIVTEDSLTQCVRDARKALGDHEGAHLRTIPRRGYMLIAEAVRPDTPSRPPASRDGAPVIAVLPLETGSADPRTTLFASSIAEDLIHALAGFKTVLVIARSTSFRIPATSDLGEAARSIGIDHYVTGRIDPDGDRFRIRIALEEPWGHTVWSDRFTLAADGLLSLPQDLATRIASRLVSSLEAATLKRAPTAPTSDVDAYGHLMRGITLLRGYGAGVNERGREHLAQAVALDPGSGLAHAYLALADIIIAGYEHAPRAAIDAARDMAIQGVMLASEDSRCHRLLGLLQLYAGAFDGAEASLTRAIDLNPCDCDALAQMGFLATMRGRPAEGLDWLNRAVRLNPLHPHWYHVDRAVALMQLARYDAAIAEFGRVPTLRRIDRLLLAGCHAMAQDAASAARQIAAVLDDDGDLDIAHVTRASMFEHETDRARVTAAVTAALDAYRDDASGSIV